MADGIALEKMIPGELIYLNLPYHPGNHLEKTSPSAPTGVHVVEATNLGYPGVEVSWTAGHDERWVSYYEVLRNQVVIDKVAKGTYYFDHSAGADPGAVYGVRTVNGAGLPSPAAESEHQSGKAIKVLDDVENGGLTFSGQWQRQAGLQPAYQGTISGSAEKGASFEFEFEGTKFIWFTKLGADGGKAQVVVDGRPQSVVDTYSADDIWGVGVYTQEFPASGRHTVRVNVLGERGGPPGYGQGSFVYVDGIRTEATR
jgi:hypothetical protein